MQLSVYMTLAIDKWIGMALVIQHVVNVHQGDTVLATEGDILTIPDSSKKMQHFSYKNEWANA